MAGFRRLYGAHPLHLLGHAGLFFVAGWAVTQIVGGGFVINWLAWFLGAALLHDLVLLPLYSVLDRALMHVAGAHGDARSGVPSGDPVAAGDRPRGWVNHVRAPAIIAGILLLVYFPLILGYSSRNYRDDTGHALAGYTRNWLLITAGLFVCSALVYGVRVIRRRPRPRPRPRLRLRRPGPPRPARERPRG